MNKLSRLLLPTVFLAWIAPASAAELIDLPAQHAAYPFVQDAIDKYRLLTPYPDRTFRGKRPFTRYEMAKALQHLLAYFMTDMGLRFSAEREGYLTYRGFLQENGGDLIPRHWAATAIQQVVSYGWMSGYPDLTFRGQNKVSRYELASQLKRIIDKLGVLPTLVGSPSYERIFVGRGGDVPPQHWSHAALREVISRGLMTPDERGRFRGDEPATQYDLAIGLVSLARLVEKEKPVSLPKPSASPHPTRTGDRFNGRR